MLTGQNGILNRATDATIENEIGTVTESIELYLTQKMIDATIDGKEESSIATLKKAGIIDDDNVINTKQLLGTKTKYGNGNKEKDVYKIIGDKLIYIDSTKNKVS